MRGRVRIAALVVGLGWQLAGWAGEPPVIAAVQQQDLQALSAALAAGAEVDAVSSESGATALILASAEGSVPAVRLLLAAGADANRVDARGWSALTFALFFHHDEVSYLLLKHGANVNQPASTADRFGSIAIPLNTIVASGTSGNRLLMPPIRRAWQGRMVRTLLSYGANPNLTAPDGDNALNIAALNNEPELVSLLLAAGADPFIGEGGNGTALMWAMAFGARDAAFRLAFTQRAVNARDADGWTALHWATYPNEFASIDGRVAIAEQLLEAGAEVDAVDSDGNTTLHLAAINYHEELQIHEAAIERLLLAHGADPFRPNHKGQTAAALAAASGHQTLVALIDQLKH